MSPVAVDGKLGIKGEIYFNQNFWRKFEKLAEEKLSSLLEREELGWRWIRTYHLDEARTNERISGFPENGDCILVLSLDGSATIKLNTPSGFAFDLETYERIRHPFEDLYLTNTAQVGKTLELLIGKGGWGKERTIPQIDLVGLIANEHLENIEADKLTILRHLISGAIWSDNSPSSGYIAWAGATLTYNGTTHTIANDNTNKKYIWWDLTSPTAFQTSDTKPTLTDDDCIVAYNDNGTHILVWNQTLIHGGILRASSIKADVYQELRNTYVFSDQDSLDSNDTRPFEMDFEIVSEMTAIVSVKLSFRIRKFRAYATGLPAGGGHTTDAGGQKTSTAKSHTHSGQTTYGGGSHNHTTSTGEQYTTTVDGHRHKCLLRSTTSSVGTHTHGLSISSGGSHDHTCPAHQHYVKAHQHTLTFGIFEEATSPRIHYHIANDGEHYGGPSIDYTTDQPHLDITSLIKDSGVGFKKIMFHSNALARVSAWVMCKVDLTA